MLTGPVALDGKYVGILPGTVVVSSPTLPRGNCTEVLTDAGGCNVGGGAKVFKGAEVFTDAGGVGCSDKTGGAEMFSGAGLCLDPGEVV